MAAPGQQGGGPAQRGADGEAAQALPHLLYLAQRRPALGDRRNIPLREVPVHRLCEVRQDRRLQAERTHPRAHEQIAAGFG